LGECERWKEWKCVGDFAIDIVKLKIIVGVAEPKCRFEVSRPMRSLFIVSQPCVFSLVVQLLSKGLSRLQDLCELIHVEDS
jgi:hypothetical protein